MHNTIPAHDFSILFDELETQADTILPIILVIRNLHQKHKTAPKAIQGDITAVLLEHCEELELGLTVVKLDADTITDEQIQVWVDLAKDDEESEKRCFQVEDVISKMRQVEEAIGVLRVHFLNEAE